MNERSKLHVNHSVNKEVYRFETEDAMDCGKSRHLLHGITRLAAVCNLSNLFIKKRLKLCIASASWETHLKSYGASLVIWDHMVLPASLPPDTRFTYHGGMEG